MKKVLIVSYYFPPAGGSAVQRVLKFVKYLPSFQWQPVVLTAEEKSYVLRDDSLLDEIPAGVKVYRVPAPDPYGWYGRGGQEADAGPADLSAIAVGEGQRGSLLNRLGLFVRSLFFIPDARIGWLPFALWKGRQIVRREKIGVIFVTSPPFTAALVGGLLSALTRVPWISDYRDPWTQAYFYFPRPGISRSLEAFLERRLLQSADRVVSINGRILDGLKNKYGSRREGKEIVIPNGYDPEDFENLEPLKDEFFSIVYTGTLNTKMKPSYFLEAVGQLAARSPEFTNRVRLGFIGRMSADAAALFEDRRLGGMVRLTAHLPHRECLRRTAGADLLLLLIPDWLGSALIVTGKLFEYLRSGRPVLCLSDSGEAADIVRDAGVGFTVPAKDIGSIKAVVWVCYERWKRGESLLEESIRWDRIEQYDRRKTCGYLASVLDEVKGKFRH
jgi:glycosyltransferase involved in cell wall biosynthesis